MKRMKQQTIFKLAMVCFWLGGFFIGVAVSAPQNTVRDKCATMIEEK